MHNQNTPARVLRSAMHNQNTPATVLRSAALVVEHAWGRGSYVNPVTGDVCAMGAIFLAAGSAKLHTMTEHGYRQFVCPPQYDTGALAEQAAHLLAGYVQNPVPVWNDQYAADAAAVAAAMRGAADKWERRHPVKAAPVQAELALASGPVA